MNIIKECQVNGGKYRARCGKTTTERYLIFGITEVWERSGQEQKRNNHSYWGREVSSVREEVGGTELAANVKDYNSSPCSPGESWGNTEGALSGSHEEKQKEVIVSG